MKKKIFLLATLVLGLAIIDGVMGYYILNHYPKVSLDKVLLGQEFTLKKDEVAHVKGLNVSLKLNYFENYPPPKGQLSDWSGLAVHYDLIVNGKVYSSHLNKVREAPYDVVVKDTDYITYATFIINNKK